MKKCSISGCTKHYAARGYCLTHYQQKIRSGELRVLPRINGGPCRVVGCSRFALTRGMCDYHYQKEMAKMRPCRIENCSEFGKYKDGLCEKHHSRLINSGNTDDPTYNKSKKCSIPTCKNTVHAVGLCKQHYGVKTATLWKQARRKARLCVRCGKSNDKKLGYCSNCNKLYTEKRASRRKRFAEQGLCSYCGRVKATIFRLRHGAEEHTPVTPMCETCYIRKTASFALGAEKHWKVLKDIWDKQNGKCFYTGISLTLGINTSVDHIIPRSKGGLNIGENLCWCLFSVNQAKNNLSVDEFIILCQQVIDYKRNKL